MTWLEAATRWYLALVACSWSFAPLVYWLCRSLSDRGASIVRPIALLAAIYPAWLLASLGTASFGVWPVAITVVCAGVIGWALLNRQPGRARLWRRTLLVAEAASLALFAAYIWLRGYTPQILGTEKPMDVAFLAAAGRTATMPPPDPWFAGEAINYYYLGYLQHATIARIAGVPPEIGFNLALATLFSMTAVAAFGLAWNVVRPRLDNGASAVGGLLAAVGIAVAGNLYAPWRLLHDARGTLDAWWWDTTAGIGWRSSRIVCDGPRVGNLCPPPATESINEFPFFSFLLGDLHPHLMAMPFTLVAIALAWNLARHAAPAGDSPSRDWLARLALSGAIVGSLLALNTWDYPTFITAGALGVIVGFGGSLRRSSRLLALFAAASVVAWLPFLALYDAPTTPPANGPLSTLPLVPSLTSAVAFHLGERTSAGEYLTIFGVPYLVGVAFVVLNMFRGAASPPSASLRSFLMAAVGVLVAAVLLSAPVILLCGIPLALALEELRKPPRPTPTTFVLGALSLAWTLSILVELVYIRDAFDDRMNTLFKVYLQTWTLYAVAAAVAVTLLWAASPARSWQRPTIVLATGAALVAGLAYPVVASYQWTDHFASWRGLDGLAYAEQQNPGDVAAIRWLAANGEPEDVILEAAGCSYRPSGLLPFNRVSAFTGLPTVIGWANHERQWRAGQPANLAAITARQEDVLTMYDDPQSPLFDAYGVRWLVVGLYEEGNWTGECPTAGPYPSTESSDYPGPGWIEVFQSDGTRIFERVTHPAE